MRWNAWLIINLWKWYYIGNHTWYIIGGTPLRRLVPSNAEPRHTQPVTNWDGRQLISTPLAATPMIHDSPHPIYINHILLYTVYCTLLCYKYSFGMLPNMGTQREREQQNNKSGQLNINDLCNPMDLCILLRPFFLAIHTYIEVRYHTKAVLTYRYHIWIFDWIHINS